ncbi:MAG TPA: FAD-linked oxidase C-terminal domain-containing protein [Cytophagaceae bacterium]|jgi:FAD/FMN-containing dehydrogenase/Fe-S oxidoreductase|nr:FAD-linked oxidase C-terminal domain-containing protein [Cytophagaceae bacterium]
MLAKLDELRQSLEGDLFTDVTMRTLYATDASVYREMPLAVARPRTKEDIKKLISFANTHKTSLIPRTAGTSLAGQVVGKGIVVDVSLYWNKILEVNKEEKWVRVQPAVNLDELNKHLASFGLFFGPETSTSNRCMIGGMVGNNSCGSHSMIYGTTRDHVLELQTILSDGNEVTFNEISNEEFNKKCQGDSLENKIYKNIQQALSDKSVQEEIRNEFPKPSIRRRNTGYAIDELLETSVFTEGKDKFNMCKLLAGSEGTLAFTTEIKLNLVDAPPKVEGVVAVHMNSIEEAALATIIARKYKPGAVELLDDIVLNCAKQNIEQQKNLFFIQGDPKALIIVEWARHTKEEIDTLSDQLIAELKSVNLGYHFPKVWGADIKKIWTLRKAGLGLLANVPGDPKAVACIEDTAVDVNDQPQFVIEFQNILKKYNQQSVFYAHIGDGELHLRPILDLKIDKDREMFHTITDEVATLVKKFRGSLSGEHGDGRVRGEFIRKMIGEKNYQLICDLKKVWDPNDIFNPGKIVHTPKMNEFLRYENNQKTNEFNTVFNFEQTGGILRMAEKCNGSGDCRKSAVIGGTMCPSYMATKSEKETTRARANILREFLTRSTKPNKFDHQEIKDVYDLCLSCKGCKSECPSNVDVAMMKAEFLHQYYKTNGVPFRTKMIGNFELNMKLASIAPGVYNFLMSNSFTSGIAKNIMGIAPKRNFPLVYKTTLRKWAEKNLDQYQPSHIVGTVNLFCDEYTNFNDTEVGIKAIKLLTKLGYQVNIPDHIESGRTFLSKGLLEDAKKVAKKNVAMLKDVVRDNTPLIGIEPSAILTFRDEYPLLVDSDQLQDARNMVKNCMLIDEFIAREAEAGRIKKESFSQETKNIKLHGHCHQKALSSVEHSKKMLSIPVNYNVEVIPSGCCGMAGSFGYEKEHYDVSMNVGELVLFPAVRKASADTIIAAPGTSCRHQIHDGTQRDAKHTLEVLFDALV